MLACAYIKYHINLFILCIKVKLKFLFLKSVTNLSMRYFNIISNVFYLAVSIMNI
jgi:hypothetical protein